MKMLDVNEGGQAMCPVVRCSPPVSEHLNWIIRLHAAAGQKWRNADLWVSCCRWLTDAHHVQSSCELFLMWQQLSPLAHSRRPWQTDRRLIKLRRWQWLVNPLRLLLPWSPMVQLYIVWCKTGLSFVILTSGHSDAQSWACPDIRNYKWRLNPVWHRMLYSCSHTATVGVKGLRARRSSVEPALPVGLVLNVA